MSLNVPQILRNVRFPQIPWLFAQVGLDARALLFLDEFDPAKAKAEGRLQSAVLVGAGDV